MDLSNDLLDLLSKSKVETLPVYSEILARVDQYGPACNTPAMEGISRSLFEHPGLFLRKFAEHAIYEEAGGRLVESFVDRAPTPGLREEMKRHSEDELRHGRLLTAVVEELASVFNLPPPASPARKADSLFPVGLDHDLQTLFCFVHTAEVRSWIMTNQYIGILNDQENEDFKGCLMSVLQALDADEHFHLAYSAKHVNLWMKQDPGLREVLEGWFLFTHRESWREVSRLASLLAEEVPVPYA